LLKSFIAIVPALIANFSRTQPVTVMWARRHSRQYDTRRKSSVPKGKCTDDLIKIIEDKLLATWSPEQIANTVTLGLVSFKTIYNWLYSGKLTNTSVTVLRQKANAEMLKSVVNFQWRLLFQRDLRK
jgi:IS30 family transposase